MRFVALCLLEKLNVWLETFPQRTASPDGFAPGFYKEHDFPAGPIRPEITLRPTPNKSRLYPSNAAPISVIHHIKKSRKKNKSYMIIQYKQKRDFLEFISIGNIVVNHSL